MELFDQSYSCKRTNCWQNIEEVPRITFRYNLELANSSIKMQYSWVGSKVLKYLSNLQE